MTIGIFVSFELGAFELANRLITIAPEDYRIRAFLDEGSAPRIVDVVVVTRK
jgi:hypothetical protein